MIKAIVTKKIAKGKNKPMASREYSWREILRYQEKRRAKLK